MKQLVSPLETAEWKTLGWRRWGNGRRCYVASLQQQMRERGPVPDEAWETAERLTIARKIEAIVADACHFTELRFHPDDPYRIVGDWEIGDLSELDALFQIERCFRISLPRSEVSPLVERRATFGEFVDLIQEKLTGPRAAGCPQCDWQIHARENRCGKCGAQLRDKTVHEAFFKFGGLGIADLIPGLRDRPYFERFAALVVMTVVAGIAIVAILQALRP
ncbi:MAG: hypothetical protein JNL96_02665 [Planctomycetaceae bacterium]|nr:hypothetical protein [Planctomycetaceae bacterium]